jgi:hypothetical protein
VLYVRAARLFDELQVAHGDGSFAGVWRSWPSWTCWSSTTSPSRPWARPNATTCWRCAVEMPSAPQERRLYGQLLMALNAPYRPGDRLAAVEYTALTLLRKVAPRMIVVDEVHNLLAGTAHEQRASLNLLKFLSNQLKCAIVVLGTRDALAAMQTDAQIASRFPGFELPRWQENEDFRGFLAGFERQLPLRQASRISGSRAMVSAIMSATSGITGHISELLSRAAEAAIRSKKECITPELLQSVIGARTFA